MFFASHHFEEIFVMVLCPFPECLAVSNCNEVVSNYLNTHHTFNELMHLPLKHFRCGQNAKRRLKGRQV